MEDRGLLMVDGGMEGWKEAPLDQVCHVEYGTRVVKKRDAGSTYPVYGGGGATFMVDSANRSDRLVISRFGMSEQCTRFVSGEFFLNDSGLTVSPREQRFLDQRFLDLQLLARNDEIYALGRGTAQKNLDVAAFRELSIVWPPLPEQGRIVAILDEVFEGIDRAIANTERNLANARELFESYLNRVFTEKGEGWVERKLGEVCHISSSLVDPRLDEYANCPHIGAGNIESVTGTLSAVLSAQEEGLISGKFFFDQRMVLYSKIRPYLRKIARPHFDGLCSADIYPLDPDPILISRDFLFFLLLSPQFTEYAINGSARAGMPKVNRNHLFNYKSQMPPIDEQVGITSYLDRLAVQVHDLQSHYTRKLASLAELKQSILRKAFSGELTGAGDQTSEVLKTSEV